jgi:hypothetical protein
MKEEGPQNEGQICTEASDIAAAAIHTQVMYNLVRTSLPITGLPTLLIVNR